MAQNKGVLRQPQDFGRPALIAIALIAVVVMGLSAFSGSLASIFSGSNESGEDPQQGADQVATETLEPTAMPTATNTPTQEPTPTATPGVVDELPNGFDTILSLIQEAEPEAYVETAPCINNDEAECVVAADFCPEGQECPHLLLITDQYLANVAFFGDKERALEEMKSYASRHPSSMFDSERVFKVVEYTRLCSLEDATGVLLTSELQTELNSVFGTPPERTPWRLAAFPITEAALKELLVSGLESIGPYGDSESCS